MALDLAHQAAARLFSAAYTRRAEATLVEVASQA
jgi:hypothetical protein